MSTSEKKINERERGVCHRSDPQRMQILFRISDHAPK